MSTPLEPWLHRRCEQLQRDVKFWSTSEFRWSLARLGAFLLAAAGWVPLRHVLPLAILIIAAGLTLFAWALVRHRRARARHAISRLEHLVISEARQRVGGQLVAIRSPSRPPDSPIPALASLLPSGTHWPLTEQERDDLDLYAAPVGIFGLLNRTSTATGAQRLRDWAENLCLDPTPILSRQSAARWLAEQHEIRSRLLARLAALRRLDRSMNAFAQALDEAKPFVGRFFSVLARIWSFAGLALVLLGLSFLVDQDILRGLGLVAGVVVFNSLATLRIRTSLRQSLHQWESAADFAQEYVQVARQAVVDLPAQGTAFSPLATLRDALIPVCAPRSLPAALRYIDWVSGGGMVRVALNLTALYDLHVIQAIHHHLIPRRHALQLGLSALADLEALLSLASFAAEQPAISWPIIVPSSAAPLLRITAGRHPLIRPDQDVPNDLSLSAKNNLWVITGSNMSGKSTFLRMAGVNVLLAQMGSALGLGRDRAHAAAPDHRSSRPGQSCPVRKLFPRRSAPTAPHACSPILLRPHPRPRR